MFNIKIEGYQSLRQAWSWQCKQTPKAGGENCQKLLPTDGWEGGFSGLVAIVLRFFFFMLQTYFCGLRNPQNIFCVPSKLHTSHLFKVIWPCRFHLSPHTCHIFRTGSLCYYGKKKPHRDKRFYSLFVQGCFFGKAKQTNAVFFSNIWFFFIDYHKAQLHLVWLHKCLYLYSLSKKLVEERLSSFFCVYEKFWNR